MSGPDDFWASFGDDSDFEEVTCDTSTNIATEVLEQCGLQYRYAMGGPLKNMDLKRMDAMQVIHLSLLELSAQTGIIYEPVMAPDGVVDFVEVGKDVGLSGGDVYYEIQTAAYRDRCGGVMITGGKPLAKRKNTDWHPIWRGGPKEVYDTSLLVNRCIDEGAGFSQQATIVFTDPHLNSSYEDGIDNLYDITSENPYDSIIGFATYMDPNGADIGPDTSIRMQSSAKILVPIDLEVVGLGKLARRPAYAEGENPECWVSEPTSNDGVPIDIPQDFRFESVRGTMVDKFQAVTDVYVIGREIQFMRGEPRTQSAAVQEDPAYGDAIPMAFIENSYNSVFRLSQGVHYVIVYDDSTLEKGKQPRVVFADNSRPSDPIGIDGTKKNEFFIHPDCGYAAHSNISDLLVEGYILPVDKTKGIWVEEIYVTLLLDTPSIVVYNPDGANRKAYEIASRLIYLVKPLVITDEPSPVAFNGRLIDLVSSKRDHDPTTAQNFTDTDYESALDAMQGTGLTLTLSFLDEEGCEKLSEALYEYLNSGDGVEATYVCGPSTEVTLGGTAPNGGIVNSITYSYQDSNSYTISVNAGPILTGGFSQISGGPVPKVTEELSAKGTIIEDMGNHVMFKVRIDGFGERIAINMAPTILRVGDKVQCSVHNIPVEA